MKTQAFGVVLALCASGCSVRYREPSRATPVPMEWERKLADDAFEIITSRYSPKSGPFCADDGSAFSFKIQKHFQKSGYALRCAERVRYHLEHSIDQIGEGVFYLSLQLRRSPKKVFIANRLYYTTESGDIEPASGFSIQEEE